MGFDVPRWRRQVDAVLQDLHVDGIRWRSGDGELHHELVPFDADLAQRMSDRGVRILQATDAGELLPRIATSSDFFECRFCPWAKRCWEQPV